MKKNVKSVLKRITAWVLLIAVSVNSLGGTVSAVNVTEYDREKYEKASEEAEEEIRAAEKAAGINASDEQDMINDGEKAGEIEEEEIAVFNETKVYEDRVINSVMTLTDDLHVGNLNIGGTLHLNGYKLTVHGNITNNGFLYIENGEIEVLGNYIEGYDSELIMDSPSDKIVIEGDYKFYFDTIGKHVINAGTFEVKGNITGEGTIIPQIGMTYESECNFILLGDELQTIDIPTGANRVFKHLIINNTSEEGVYSKYILNTEIIDDPDGKLHYARNVEYGLTLDDDGEFLGDYCLAGGILDLNGHSYTIKGDLILAGGEVRVNGGSLVIEGDYHRQFIYEEGEKRVTDSSIGRLIMENDTDYVLIKGNYHDYGIYRTKDDLTAGTMELKGNIYVDGTRTQYLLETSGTHTIIISGEDALKLEGKGYASSTFDINNLIIDQPETGSFECNKVIKVLGTIEHRSGNISASTDISNANIESAIIYGDVVLNKNYTFSKNLTIYGTLKNDFSGVINIKNVSVNIEGDVYNKSGSVTWNISGENGRLSVADDYNISGGSSIISGGMVEIGGDINGDKTYYFKAQSGSTVYFNGTKQQKIVGTNSNMLFDNIIVDNPMGVMADTGITINNVSVKHGMLEYTSGGVHGFTLENDEEYDGDLNIAGGVLKLNGHSLHIKGNLIVSGGTVEMTKDEDILKIDGDYIIESAVSSDGKLTAGRIELKGDFTNNGGNESFCASGTHTVVLCGNEAQNISSEEGIATSFNNVSFDNQTVLSNVPVISGKITKKADVIGKVGITPGTEFDDDTYDGDVVLAVSGIQTKDITINGDIDTGKSVTWKMNGKTLITDRTLTCGNSSNIYIDQGSLECGSIEVVSGCSIYMQDENDSIVIKGDLVINSGLAGLKKGSVCVAGDVIVKKDNCVNMGTDIRFEFNGDKKQTITMVKKGNSLGNLIINNTSEEGIYISDELNYESLENLTGCKFIFADGGIMGYALKKDENIEGDLTISCGEMDLNGYTLTVSGNLNCKVPLYVNNGTLKVTGDLSSNERSIDLNGGSIITDGDYNCGDGVVIENGTIVIGGNWNSDGSIKAISSDISLKGDVNTAGSVSFYSDDNVSFDGVAQQSLKFSGFEAYNPTINNPEGLVIEEGKEIYFGGEIITNGYPVDGWIRVFGNIKEDTVHANLSFSNDIILEHDMYVEGDVKIGGLIPGGHKITVTGNCNFDSTAVSVQTQDKGLIDVKGDVYIEKNKNSQNNQETRRLMLSGDGKQTIYVNNTNWNIHELDITNRSDEGVYADHLFRADIINDPNKKLYFPIKGEVGATLNKDTVIQGDYTLLTGCLDLNGYKLTIMGDLHQPGGTVAINGGELNISGDYIIASESDKGYSGCLSVLLMNNNKDHICIGKDMIISPQQKMTDYITAGTLELKGDFELYNFNGNVQYFSENVEFLFSGDERQYFHNFSNIDRFSFGYLKIENIKGLVVDNDLTINGPVSGSEYLEIEDGKTLYWKSKSIPEMSSLDGNLCIMSDISLIKDMTVNGTLTIEEQLNINGHHMLADNIIINGKCHIGGGILQINEDLTMNLAKSTLIMDDPLDVIQIKGNMKASNGSMELTAGKLELQGNVNISEISMIIGEDHNTILSGKTRAGGNPYVQTVNIPEDEKFAKLILNKPRECYVFCRDVESMCMELIDDVKDITAPSVPEGFTVTECDYTCITLSWEESTDDIGVAGYDIYRNDKKIISITGCSYTDKKLVPGTEYKYYVVAKDAVLNMSDATKTLTVCTKTDDVAPTVPTELTVEERLADALSISFIPSTDNVSVAGYHIYRDGELIGDTKTNSYTDTGLEKNREYCYQASAYDGAGNESDISIEYHLYTQTVEISDVYPSEYSTLSGDSAEISVNFLNAGSTRGYHVYMEYIERNGNESGSLLDKSYGCNTTYRSTINATGTIDTTKITGEEITVTVRICDAGGYEYEKTLTYYLDKSAPSKLDEVGVSVNNGVAVISFARGKEADIAGYRIYRQEEGCVTELLIESDTPDKTYYYDKQIEEGKEYSYYFSAYDAEGLEGEKSSAVTITADADKEDPVIDSVLPLNGTLTGNVTFTITAEDNKALDRLTIEKIGIESDILVKEIYMNTNEVDCQIDTSGMEEDITLRFSLYDKAGNKNAEEFLCNYTVDNDGPDAPENLKADIHSTTAVLSWDEPHDDDYEFALVCQVMDNGESREITRTVTTTGCIIEGLNPGETTMYQVTFFDIYGNKGESSEIVEVTAGEDTIAPRIISASPGGGYYNNTIPLDIRAYDNCGISKLVIDCSADKNEWETVYTKEFETTEKEVSVKYPMDVSEKAEGNLYIRAYCIDGAGNTGDMDQILIQFIIDHTAPAAADKLTATGENGNIYIKWTEPVDNDVEGYRLYRSVEGLNAYICIADSVSTLSYYDRSALYGVSYCYQVSAYDHAGNEGARSNVAAAQKLPDETAPEIYSINPCENSILAGKVNLSALVSDNDRIAEVEFAIKSSEQDSTKIIVGNVLTDISADTVTCSLDTREYPNGAYILYVTATDASGNKSEKFTVQYTIHNVSLDTPVLTADPGNWCVNLYSTVYPTLSYVLYRKNQQLDDDFKKIMTGTGNLIYKDTDINPRYTYAYQLLIEDEAGNYNVSAVQYVKANAIDDIAPKAVIETNTSVVEGYEVILSGAGSNDNDKISKYIWEIEGEEKEGPRVVHSFKKAGDYIVKLTVTDASNNTDYTTARISVLPKASSGRAIVEVRNTSGSPLKDVTVYVNSSAEKNDSVKTDKSGQAVIMQKPGRYKIALYIPGYVAVEESIEIELFGEKMYVFTLSEGETVSADFSVRQMTFDEIVAAGIDLNDPENQHVFTVQTILTFVDAGRAPEAWIEDPALNSVAIRADHKKSGGGGPIAPPGGGGGPGDVPKPDEEEDEEDKINELYYKMCITQSISWLKDMYEATLIVYNNAKSQTIVAKDLKAKLDLPYGLAFAATKNGQNQEISIPDLKGGEAGSAAWYIRGDSPGTYKLNASLEGKLQPFDTRIDCMFTSNEFEVSAGNGLVLKIEPENRAEKGEPYYIYFTLTNEGGKEFYNVHTTFGTKHENSKRFAATADRSKKLPVMSEGDEAVIECLKPGESISGIIKRMVPVTGDKWYSYKALVDAECKAVKGANLGVAVVLSVTASHVPVPTLVYQEPTAENSEADPVNVSTGAYTDNITALSVVGVNPISADIMYDSNAVSDLGEFGYGWAHNYETRLKDMQDGTIQYYVSPTGYYTFLADHFDENTSYKENAEGYLVMDLSDLPVEETFKCLNENRAGYQLSRDIGGNYLLTDKSGTITRFDNKGNLTSIENREGKIITVKRESDKFTVTDKVSGKYLTYKLDESTKLVTSVTDGKRTAYFHYDEDNCLKQFDNAIGESTYYTYDSDHRITTVTNDDGVIYVTNTYVRSGKENSDKTESIEIADEEKYSDKLGDAYKIGMVKTQKDALGNVTTFSYKEDENTGNLTTTVSTRSGAKKVTVTDPYGNVISRTNEAGATITSSYDDNGNEIYVNQPEMTVSGQDEKSRYSIAYEYDSKGNMTSMTNSMLQKGENEVVMTYDDDGNMLSMKNRNGESMSCTYYDNGLIHTVTDQNNNTITYTYNEQGQVKKEEDGRHRTIEYTYDNGQLKKVKDKNGYETSYEYNYMGLVKETSVKDNKNDETYTTYTYYDDLGRVSMELDASKGATFYDYDCNGNLTEKTMPSGSRTVYKYDGNNQMIKESVYPDAEAKEAESVTDYHYTAEGLLDKVTDEKSETVIVNGYDAVGNKTSEIEKKGDKKLSEKHYEYDELGNMTKETVVCLDTKGKKTGELSTEYIYYPNGKLNKVTDYTGAETVYSYDKSWRTQTIDSTIDPMVTYEYDPAGRVKKEIVGKNESGENSTKESTVTSYEYDIYGHVTKAADAMGNSTLYRYDANGNLTETEDATGRVAYSKYDSLNRVIETGIRKPGSKADSEKIYQNILAGKPKDNEGNYSAEDKRAAMEEADTYILTKTSYSLADNSVTVTDMINGGKITTFYDTSGREIKTEDGEEHVLSETIYDTENRILQSIDAKGMLTEYVYNNLGQIEKTRTGKKGAGQKDGTYAFEGKDIHTEQYGYDDLGRTDKVIDAEGGVSSVVFDSLGRIVSLKDPNQNGKDAEGKTWSLNGGNTYTYKYDSRSLLIEESNSLNNVTKYEYNSNLLLSRMTDGEGKETAETNYEYDALNRIRQVSDDLGTITYDYDYNGNILEISEKESLLSFKKSIIRTYDNLNRVTSYTDYKGRKVEYSYDSLGNLKTLTYPGGEVVTYTYNPDGTVDTMTSKSGGTFTYGYDNYGRLCRITRADGSVEERKYDAAGQLTDQVDKDKSGNILQKNHYDYDVFGEITGKTTSTSGDTDRLVIVSMEYNSANRLIKYNGQDVTYDSRGNMIYGPVDGEMTNLEYDCRNRLVKAGKVSYTYDCENTRIATTEDGITTEYVTDTGGSLSRMLIAYENIGTANTSETYYYYGPEGLAAQNNDTTGQYFAYHYDNIGSTTLVTDKTGRKVEEFAYGTYGELLTEPKNNIRFLYNGSYGVVTDSNGLYYMRARYYNPDIKRFINQDIKVGDISNGQGLNRYAYCEGNPVSMVDPFGLCGESANDQGEESRYQWLHNALDIAGLVFDGADIINAGVYALEGRWGEAAVSLACALPAIGTAIAGVSKATKLAKAGNIIGQTMKYAGKAYMTVQTATQALEMAGDAKVQYAVNGGKLTPEMALNIAGAAAMGALAVMSAGSLMKDVTSLTKMSNIRMETTVRDVADNVSGKTLGGEGEKVFAVSTSSKITSGSADFYVGSEGVAKNLSEYDNFINRSGEADLFLPDEYYQKLDDNIAKAVNARDAEVVRIRELSRNQQSKYATVVAGVDLRTGEVFVGAKKSNKYGRLSVCAEDIVYNGLGGNVNANIIMTPAVRPKTLEIIPVCESCQAKYPINQFMRGTTFK